MKKWICIALIMVMGINLNGCSLFPDGTLNEVEEEGEPESLNVQETKITGTLMENMKVDAVIDANIEADWNQYKAVDAGFTKEETENNAKMFEHDGVVIKNVEEIATKEGEVLRYIYTYSDGSQFSNGSNIIYRFSDYNDKAYNEYIPEQYGIQINKEERFPFDELDGLSKKDSIDKAKDILKKLGVEVNDNPTVYAMDANSQNYLRNERLKIHNKEKYKNWTKDDECYYIVFRQNIGGLSICNTGFSGTSYGGVPAKATVVIGRKGLEYLNVDYRFDIKETTSVKGQIISMEDALNMVKSAQQYYDYQTITEMELCYMPVIKSGFASNVKKEYEVYPFWKIILEYKYSNTEINEGDFTNRNKGIFINAVNGALYTESYQNIID
ncbi:MAG: hypothetical protein ACI4D4_03195 [Lachnospira sp.]